MRKRWVGLAALCFLVVLGGCGSRQEPVKVYFFHNNPCASCNERGELEKAVAGLELPGDGAFEIWEYRAFSPESAGAVNSLKEFMGNPAVVPYPLVVVGDRVLAGYDAIREGFPGALREAAGKASSFDPNAASGQRVLSESPTVPPGVSYGVLFTTEACGDCRKAERALGLLPGEVEVLGRESKVEIRTLSIAQAGNTELLQDFFEAYQVPVKEQRVPILFLRERYFSGESAIADNAEAALLQGGGLEFRYPEPRKGQQGLSLWSTAAVGFLNGWNPCALSMLFLLLSLVLPMKNGVPYGISYLIGKFAAYFGVGMALYWAASAVSFTFLSGVQVFGTLILAVFCAVFAVLNFLDFLSAMRQEYGKIRLQLPTSLRKLGSGLITAAAGKGGGRFPALLFFLLGIAVSGGEFLCTGQVYLAAILYLAQTGGNSGVPLAHLLLYVAVMCLPSALILLLAGKGKRILELSESSRKKMPWVKLLNTLVFLIFLGFALASF